MSYWDTYWSRVPDNSHYALGGKHIVDSIIRSLGNHSQQLRNSKIVELGGGGGRISLELAKRFNCQVTLVDYSKIGLERARKSFEDEGLPARIIHNNVFERCGIRNCGI